MKKILIDMKTLGMTALVAGALILSSCDNVKCTEARDDNHESTTEECNETATVAKFVGNWIGSPGAYPFNVTAGTDYKINVSTNFGLTDGSGNPLTPANLNNWNVSKNEATLTTSALYNGTLSNATVSHISSTSASVNFTLSGFGTAVDGTYTESLTK